MTGLSGRTCSLIWQSCSTSSSISGARLCTAQRRGASRRSSGAGPLTRACLPRLCHHNNGRRYYWDKGILITDNVAIRKSYLRGWFAIDVISVLPFDYLVRLLSSSSDTENIARTTRFMRFTRIMRFARLIKLAKLTQLRDAIETFQMFLTNVGISAMDLEFGEGRPTPTLPNHFLA
jgi:hypothetical protein